MKVKLRDFVELVKTRVDIKDVDEANYISTENMLPNRGGVEFGNSKLPTTKTVNNFIKGDILISNIRPYFKKIWFADRSGTRSSDVLCFRVTNERLSKEYLYCILQSDSFFNYVTSTSKGTKMPRGDKESILDYEFELVSKEKQYDKYHSILLLERKIYLNNRINDNLDSLLTTVFKNKIFNINFNEAKLTDIANYKNGLAMQKYRPQSNEKSLPVLKIKELNQGFTDSVSDRCSSEINEDFIVKTGDIIFSWSGTLLVKNWTGTIAGLNQHLFKVTSNKYPNWFIYEWTKYHLNKFQTIASGKATTIGHIKRSDLKASKVYIPNERKLNKLDTLMKPIYDKRIEIIKENHRLIHIKKALLQKYF